MDHLSFGSLGLGVPPSPNNSQVNETAPQLIHQSVNTAIYRLKEKGIKVSLDPDPTPEESIRKLLHEQNISKFLPPSCSKRNVIDITTFNRRPALTFEWVNGITLKKWLTTGHHMDLDIRLRVSMAIAKTLSDFHEGGVVYNSLSPENIVLEPCGNEFVATFIDLSEATYFSNSNSTSSTAASVGGWNSNAFDQRSTASTTKGDLKALGEVLNAVFQGDGSGSLSSSELAQEEKHGREDGSPHEYVASTSGDVDFTSWAKVGRRSTSPQSLNDDDTDRTKQRKRTSTVSEYLPLYLSALISTLLGEETSGVDDSRGTASSTNVFYETAKSVYLDIKVMKESKKECFRKVYPDEWTANGRLCFQGDLFYGRQLQSSMLLNLVRSSAALGGQPLMATISGYPGTGKSALVRKVKQELSDTTHFIGAKFVHSARPDFVLVSALDSFFGRILKDNTDQHLYTSMKWRIEFAIGSGNNSALFDVLPNLCTWLTEGSEDTGTSDNSNEQPKLKGSLGSSHRLKFMLCKLIGAIACNVKPLVLFLDDIQWADGVTLDIIRMVLTDPDTKHFIFLGSYRDNEVQQGHLLTAKLNAIRNQNIRIVPVKVGPIERDMVTTMLSEVLCLPPSLCRPLSTTIHSKTGGVILFILRFLASLCDEGLMWYSLNFRRWCCDLNKIRQKQIEADVVSLMRSHMSNMSKKTQMSLMIASCLGPRFDPKTFDRANKKSALEDNCLETCLEYGFLQTEVKESEREYVWCHDQIQQAAYELIPILKRPSFHLLLGSRLFMKTPASEMDRAVFTVVDLLNRGLSLIDDQSQKYEVAQLNLKAGETALLTSAFHSAVQYLMRGISLLGSNSWVEMYDLTINLYDAASKALFVTGEFTELSKISEQPLIHAKSFEDKLTIYNNVIRALAATAKFEEGIKTCIFVLSQLGIAVPTEINLDIYSTEVCQVKQLMSGKTENDLLSLPLLVEKQKLAAMQFLNHLLIMTFIAKPRLNPIIVFRLIKISVKYGVCTISAFAFGCYGAWLVSDPGSFDVEVAYRMGKVAVNMMKKLDAVEMTPRVYTTVYSFINIWKEPWQALLPKHLEAFSSGSKTGDIEYAISAYYQHCNTAIYGCGENLETLSQKIPSHAKCAFQFNQLPGWRSLVILNQLALDLMGVQQNAFVPFMSGMAEETCLTTARQNNEISTCRLICHKRKYCAFFTGDMDTAAKMHDICEGYNQLMGPTGRLVHAIVGVFIDGMIGFFFARKHARNEAKWKKIGQDAIQTMRTWTSTCSEWNFSNKLFLLEAEFFYLQENYDRALACYDAAIKAAREHRFIHEQGLACEKLATFLLQQQRYGEAMAAFADAKWCYEKWRAHALVKRMEKAIGQLMPLVTNTSTYDEENAI